MSGLINLDIYQFHTRLHTYPAVYLCNGDFYMGIRYELKSCEE